MKNKQKITPEKRGTEIICTCKSLVSKSFASPMINTEIKEMICAYDLSIIFCDTILNNIKWYQSNLKAHWLKVRIHIIEQKMYFYEAMNHRISNSNGI